MAGDIPILAAPPSPSYSSLMTCLPFPLPSVLVFYFHPILSNPPQNHPVLLITSSQRPSVTVAFAVANTTPRRLHNLPSLQPSPQRIVAPHSFRCRSFPSHSLSKVAAICHTPSSLLKSSLDIQQSRLHSFVPTYSRNRNDRPEHVF